MKENEQLVTALTEKGLTLSGAESCTGGLVSGMITAVPGSSAVFTGAVVAYSNRVKINILGVANETLEKHGAVSEETALEMAAGIKKIMMTDIAYSVTGIAGPEGGTEQKPAGTVCFAVAAEENRSYTKHFTGDRKKIREQASLFIINELIIA